MTPSLLPIVTFGEILKIFSVGVVVGIFGGIALCLWLASRPDSKDSTGAQPK